MQNEFKYLVILLSSVFTSVFSIPVMSVAQESSGWVKVDDFEGIQMGGKGNDLIEDLAIDIESNVYLTVNESLDEDKKKQTCSLLKYGSDGRLVWSNKLGNKKFTAITDVYVGNDGFVYVTGSTTEDLFGLNAGKGDVFLAKFSPRGNLVTDTDETGKGLWPKQFGTREGDVGSKIIMDREGNLYLAGFTQGVLFRKEKLKEKLVRKVLYGSGMNTFFLKFDSSGKMYDCKDDDCRWPVLANLGYDEIIYDMVIDDSAIYFTGQTYSPRSSVIVDHSKIEYSSFMVGKMDFEGNIEWTRKRGKTNLNLGCGIDVDSQGFVNVVGTTYKKFQEGSIQELGKIEDMNFSFVSRYDQNGNLVWTRYSEPNPKMEFFDIAVDRNNDTLYVLSSIVKDEVVIPELLNYDQEGREKGKKAFRGGYLLSWPQSLKIHDNYAYIVGKTNSKFFGKFFARWDGFLIRYDLDINNNLGN